MSVRPLLTMTTFWFRRPHITHPSFELIHLISILIPIPFIDQFIPSVYVPAGAISSESLFFQLAPDRGTCTNTLSSTILQIMPVVHIVSECSSVILMSRLCPFSKSFTRGIRGPSSALLFCSAPVPTNCPALTGWLGGAPFST